MYSNVLIQAQKRPLKKNIPLSTKDEDVSGTLHWTYKSNKAKDKRSEREDQDGRHEGRKRDECEDSRLDSLRF